MKAATRDRRSQKEKLKNVIYADFVQRNYSLKELSVKWNVPISALYGWSRKEQWPEKRQDYTDKFLRESERLKLNPMSVASENAKQIVGEKLDIIGSIEELLKLKIYAEQRAFLEAKDTPFLKSLLEIINKSKDSIVELIKVKQLLTGNPTANVKLSGDERNARLDRIKGYIVKNLRSGDLERLSVENILSTNKDDEKNEEE
jgi:hypothetical protein